MGRALRYGAGLGLALFVWTCSNDRVTGPVRPGTLSLDLRAFAALPGEPVLPLDSVLVRLRHPTETTYVYTQASALQADTLGDSLALKLDVPLSQSPEDFILEVTVRGASITWYAVTAPLQLVSGAENTPQAFLATYVGPGANAASVTVLPADTTMLGGTTMPLHADVHDSSDAIVPGVPVGYRLSDATRGTIAVNYLTASLTASDTVRDSVWIIAETPTHVRDSTRLYIRPPPTQLTRVSGDGQTGAVGTPLLPFTVRVLDRLGAGFGGTAVTWSVTTGSASLTTTNTVTDSLGFAAVTATPTAAGTLTVTATAAGLAGSPLSFSASAVSNAPANIVKVSGDAQGDTVTRTLPQPLVVRVTNSSSAPMANIKVAWLRFKGSGAPLADTTVTDTAGLAQVTYKLGTVAGTDSVRARVAGTTLIADFGLFAVHERPSRIAKVSGDAQIDTVNHVLAPFVAAVTDSFGNGVPGEKVAWAIVAGGGSLSADTSVSDLSGRAQTIHTLGPTARTDSIRATLVLNDSTVIFTATGVAAGVRQVVIDRTADTIAVGATLQYNAALKDSAGNTIPGSVTWTSTLPTVATVSTGGLATALAAGATSIVATAGGFADTAQLFVRGIASVTVSPADTTITAIGDSVQLAAQGLDNFGLPVAGLTIRYSSATPTVATVGATTGMVHLVGAGNGVVLARDSVSGKQGAATLRVTQVVTATQSLPLLPDSLQVGVSGRGQITARALDRNGYPIPGKTFGYASRDPAVATVDQSGVVTGVSLGRVFVVDSVADTGHVFLDSVLVAVVTTPPARIQWAYDSIAVGNGGNISVALSLSRPDPSPLVVKMVSTDSFIAKPATRTVTIPANTNGTSVVIYGVASGQVTIVASDSSGLGFLPDTMVVTVVSTIEFREVGQFTQQPSFYLNQNETHQAQVFLSDPAPAGGLGVTFVYKGGNAVVTPSPAIIPAGQLSAPVTITGLAAGTDSIVPTSGGFVGRFSYAYVAANNLAISLPTYNGVLGVGQSMTTTVTIPYGMDHPLVVSSTLNPAIGVVTTTDTIPACPYLGSYYYYCSYYGYTQAYPTVFATALGTTTLTVSAPGWNPVTATLVFSTPHLGVYGSYSIVAGDPNRGYWYAYTNDSLGTSHPVSDTLRVTVTSRDTTVVAVDVKDTLVLRGSQYTNTVYNSLRAQPTAGGDSTWIVATAPGYTTDSFLVRVTKPTLYAYINYPYDGGLGIGTLAQNAFYVQIPYARPDTLWIHFSQTRPGILGPLDSVAMLPGQTGRYFATRGDTLGVDTLRVDTVKTPGYVLGYGPMAFRVDPIKVAPYSYPQTLYTISGAQPVTAYVRDSVNNYTTPLVAPLTVTLVSGNPAAYTLDSGKVTIPAGAYYSNYSVGGTDSVRVVPGVLDTVGSRIQASAPGAASDSAGALTYVRPTPLNFSIGYPGPYAGRGLKLQYNRVYVSGGVVPDSTRVALTRWDPARDSVAPDTVIIPKGQSYSAYFSVIGIDSAGTDSITATAAGYVSAKTTIYPYPSDLVVSSPGTSHQTTDAPGYVYTYTMMRLGYYQNPARPLTYTIVSTDPNVIQVDSAVTINGTADTGTSVIDSTAYYNQFKIRYVGSGTARIIVSAPGFKPDTTPAITVTGPTLHLNYTTLTLGVGQIQQYLYAYVDNAVTGQPLVVRLGRSDSLLPAGSQAFALSADSLVIPVGSSSSDSYFDVTGQNIGTALLVARAPGYSQATATISVGQPQLYAGYTNLTQYIGEVPQAIYVYTQDQSGNYRPVANPLVVGDTVSAPAVGVTDSAVVTIPALSNYATVNFTGLAVGSVGLVFKAAGYKSDTVVITVDSGQMTLYNPPNGLGPGQTTPTHLYVQLPYSVAAPLVVSLNSSAPGVATVPATVTIPAGYSYAYIPVTGVAIGTTTITATAAGTRAATPVSVRISKPQLLLSFNSTGNAGQKYYAYVYVRDSVGSSVLLTSPLTVTLTSSVPGHTQFDSATITIPAGTYSPAYTGIVFDTAGSYTITATATGYTGDTAPITITGAMVNISDFQFGPQSVTIKAGQYVTWYNTPGSSVHTTTEDSATPLWNSGNLAAGQSYYRNFGTAGTFTYHCQIHTGMTGTVVVTP